MLGRISKTTLFTGGVNIITCDENLIPENCPKRARNEHPALVEKLVGLQPRGKAAAPITDRLAGGKTGRLY
ncbi:MAG: hypothetical protein QXM16_01830 [Nitrososphaerota archaeon]